MATTKQYQWVKGDHVGKIEDFDKFEGEWLYFSNGSRVASNLIGNAIVEYNESAMIPGGLQMEGENLAAIPGESKPLPASLQHLQKNNTIKMPDDKLAKKLKDSIEESGVKTTVALSTKLKLPNKDSYHFLISFFDKETIDDHLLDLVLDKVKEDIKEFFTNNYK